MNCATTNRLFVNERYLFRNGISLWALACYPARICFKRVDLPIYDWVHRVRAFNGCRCFRSGGRLREAFVGV